MIASNFGKFNNYITDYDKLRDFLRYISYGCYHKQYLAKKLGYSDRKYDNLWSQVRSFLMTGFLTAHYTGESTMVCVVTATTAPIITSLKATT